MGIGAAIIGGSLIGGAVGLYSSSKAASAQESAAQSAAGSADASLQAQLEMFYQQREDLEPWREAGKESINKLLEMQRAGPGEFEASPGYQFRLEEGQKAMERSAAAGGKLLSGGSLKAAQRYGQDYATNDYDNFLRRYYNRLTPYQSLAGVGQTAVGQSYENQPNYMSYAAQKGNVALQAGNAQAQGYANMSNIVTGGIKSGTENYLLSNYLNNQPGYMNYGPETYGR